MPCYTSFPESASSIPSQQKISAGPSQPVSKEKGRSLARSCQSRCLGWYY